MALTRNKRITLILTLAAVSLIIFYMYRKQSDACPASSLGAFHNGAVVVLDAGHGGMDGGATGVSGILEKELTLEIAKKTDAFLALVGIPTVMTRTEDLSLGYRDGASIRQNKISDMNERLRLANETENAIYISIHLNKFSQSQYKGAQVFYAPKSELSEPLAKILQKSLLSVLNDGNTRSYKKASNDIFLMKNARCPAVTVECGFVSNPGEEALLKDPEYQKKLALAITGGYLAYVNEIT